MQPSERSRQLNKDRFVILSIPGYVTKKNESQGPWHGPSMRHTTYHRARDKLRKAKLPKNGSCQIILERWFQDRADFSEHGWTEQNRQYDALAVEDHSYEATLGERRRWEKNWRAVQKKKENKVR